MTHSSGKRPSLLDLWMSYHFDLESLAMQANVAGSTVQAMLCNQPIERAEAEQILAQLSTLLHKDYRLDTVTVLLHHPAAPHESRSDVARIKAAIEAEYQSGFQALHGFALGTAQHQFITTRMENIAMHMNELRATAGEEAVRQFLDQWGEAEP